MNHAPHILIAALVLVPSSAARGDDEVVLITREERLADVRLVEIDEQTLKVRDGAGGYRTFDLDRCIGFINPDTMIDRSRGGASTGVIVLTDGQRFPGRAETHTAGGSELVWMHRWFGEMAIALEHIAWARFDGNPSPPEPGDADVVVLRNGDRVEGFIESIGKSLRIERQGTMLDLALDRVSGIRLVNPNQPPQAHTARVWFRDGTVADVGSVTLGDDGFLRLSAPLAVAGGDRAFELGAIAGVLFDARVMRPLAALPAHDLEGPPSRYVLPAPEVSPGAAALGLRAVTLSGPIVVRYRLPDGVRRFTARAVLPRWAGPWADFELIVRDDDREVFRATMNRDQPMVSIDVELDGSELTIAIAEGANGPIQDGVILEQAMLLNHE